MKRQQKRNTPRRQGPVTYETVREIALGLPGVVEGTAYRTPAFRVGKSLIARLHPDGESLVVIIDFDQRAMRMRAEPETFYITDHYLNYPAMLVRLATVTPDDLRSLLEDAWRQRAPRRLLLAHGTAHKAKGGDPSRKPRGG